MMWIAPVATAVMLVVTFFSCVSDVRTLRIPNRYSVTVILAFAVAFAVDPAAFGPLWSHLCAMVIIFLVTYGMFAAGMIGGGDSKLGTALGLWVGLHGLLPFMFYMALMGGVLGIVSLWISKKKPFTTPAAGSWVAQAQAGRNAVPYGIALSVGAWAGMFYTGFIHNQLHEVIKIIH